MWGNQKDVINLIDQCYYLKIAQGHFSTKTTPPPPPKAREQTDNLPNTGTRNSREDTVTENVTTKRRGII